MSEVLEQVLIAGALFIGVVALIWFERRKAGPTVPDAPVLDSRTAFVPWLQSQRFQPAEVFLSRYTASGIAHDPQGKRIAILTPTSGSEMLSYSDVLGSEVIVNGEVVTRSVSEGVLARSLIGGVLFGATGAIVGGATASRRVDQMVTSIQLRVLVNDTHAPIRSITFIATRGKPVQLESALAAMDIAPHANVYEWHDRLGVIMHHGLRASASSEGPRSLFHTSGGSTPLGMG